MQSKDVETQLCVRVAGLLDNVGFDWFVSVTAQRSKVSLKYRTIKEPKGSFYEHTSVCSAPAENDNVPEISKLRPEMPVQRIAVSNQ